QPREGRPYPSGKHEHHETWAGRGILCNSRAGSAELHRGPRHCDGTVSPTLTSLGRLRSIAARSPLAVIWSGLVVGKLLHYRMTINDHVAVRNSHRRDESRRSVREGHTKGFSPCAPTTRLPGASPSPLSFRKRNGLS